MMHAVRVAFRTAGAQHIGLGHVRRCLSLALALRVKGVSSVFLLDGDPDLCRLIEAEGFGTRHIQVPDDVESTLSHCRKFNIDAIVADSYALSTSYFQAVGGVVSVVAVLDDLADRELPVTLVVNGSAGADELHYRGGPNTRYLLGPRYILLRPEFSKAPVTHTRDAIRRILVTVGGSDPYGLTSRLIQWTDASLPDVKQDVVVGPLFPDTDALKEIARRVAGTITIHENPGEIRTLMLNADIALCGGGQTTYELAATGTPTIAIRTANNQTGNLKGLSSKGALAWIGDVSDHDLKGNVIREIGALAGDAVRRAAMARRGRSLVDGHGTARVADAILGLSEAPTS